MARFTLIDLMPEIAIRDDSSGELAAFLGVFQAELDAIFAELDPWTDIFDIDRAPDKSAQDLTNFIDLILQHLGNPFAFISSSDTLRKRRVARSLVLLYLEKGTCRGVENAVRTLTGFPTQCEVVSETIAAWQLNKSFLGLDTNLYGTAADLWGFRLWVNGTLTATDRTNITEIAKYMKPKEARLIEIRQGVLQFQQIRFDLAQTLTPTALLRFDTAKRVTKTAAILFDTETP